MRYRTIHWSTVILLLSTLCLEACEPSVRSDGEKKELPVITELVDASNPVSMESQLLEILPAARKAERPDYLVELLSQLARARVQQKRLDPAKANLDEAEALLAANEEAEMLRPRAIWLLETGRYLRYMLLLERGKAKLLMPRMTATLEEAYDAARAAGDDYVAVDAAHLLGKIGTSENELDWYLKAIRLARDSQQPRVDSWFGVLYETATRKAYRLGRYEQALELSQAGFAWSVSHDDVGRAELFAMNIEVLEEAIQKRK